MMSPDTTGPRSCSGGIPANGLHAFNESELRALIPALARNKQKAAAERISASTDMTTAPDARVARRGGLR
jgi:hypothetical protein